MIQSQPSYFHLHLVSDSTGETLTTIAKAAAVQYAEMRAIEHVYPLVRTPRQLQRALQEIEQTPGIVLCTIVNKSLVEEIERRCREIKVPCLHVLQPIMKTFENYLGAAGTPMVGGQHVLDADYFKRIEALNFTMAHDDGRLPDNMNNADICILGISRTSKTPTSIYLAQRGFKTTNLPLVVVCLVASPDRIAEIRRNRAMMMADRDLDTYVDRSLISAEITYTRKLSAKYGWPVIDVTRRSVEETAAAIIKLMHDKKAGAEEAKEV
jgi:regulator of PEP synthase PpsR (kinase-PPPase family)